MKRPGPVPVIGGASRALITAGDIAADRALAFISALRLPDGMTFYERFRTDPWLRDKVFLPALSRTSEGLPQNPLVWSELPKGSMKTTALAALALAETMLEARTHVFVIAVDTDQGWLTLEALASMIAQSPTLSAIVRQTRTEFSLPRGSWVRVMSSDQASFHGIGVTSRRVRLYCDEVCQWLDRPLWDAALATLPKVADSQLIAATNAGIASSWQAEARDQMADAGAHMLIAPAGFLPSWISRAAVRALKKTLPLALWERYYQNRWVAAETSFIDPEAWAACAAPGAGPIPPYAQEEIVLAVDGALRHDSFAILGVSRDPRSGNCPCGAGEDHARRDHGVCVRAVRVWTPPAGGGDIDFAEPFRWLEDFIAHHYVAQVAYDEYQLHDMMQRLGGATGAWCKPFGQGPPRAKADVRLFALISDGRLLHPDDPDLNAHAANAALQISTGLEARGRLVKSKPGKRIDLMVALSMASSESLRLIL